MRTAVSALELLEPRSLKEALRLLRDEGPLVPLAGCTDVYVNLNFGILPQKRFLNLWGLDELKKIRVRDGLLSVGALATYSQIIASPHVGRRAPILAAAAREIGGGPVPHRGDRGRNIRNRSPAGGPRPV